MRENLEVAVFTLVLLLGAGSVVALCLSVASFVTSRRYESRTWRSTYVDEALATFVVAACLLLAAAGVFAMSEGARMLVERITQ